MKNQLIAVAIGMISSAALAGGTAFHSDGTSSTQVGNTYYHSDGSSSTRVGNTYFNSDGSSTIGVGDIGGGYPGWRP